MIVRELVERFGFEIAAGKNGLGRFAGSGYCGDLLSDVMANAPQKSVWLTVQGHQNVAAVAVLREMAAVIICGGHLPEDELREKADLERIPILLSPASAFDLAGRLHEAGVGR